MTYLIVENNTITNIIIADSYFATTIGAVPYYTGAEIGKPYDPPTLDKANAKIADMSSQIANLASFSADLLYQLDVQKLNGGNIL